MAGDPSLGTEAAVLDALGAGRVDDAPVVEPSTGELVDQLSRPVRTRGVLGEAGHIELYARTMKELGLSRATIGRRLGAGFYRFAVIGGVIEHSPAE